MADSRDDVGNEGDVAADAKDVIADARDVAADVRRVELTECEERVLAFAAEAGLSVDRIPRATGRASRVAAPTAAVKDRESARRERLGAEVTRDAATERRLDNDRPTLLGLAFAGIAEQLYDAETYDEVLTRIAEAAVATVTGASQPA